MQGTNPKDSLQKSKVSGCSVSGGGSVTEVERCGPGSAAGDGIPESRNSNTHLQLYKDKR